MIVTYDLTTGRITGAHEVGNEDEYLTLLAAHGQGGVKVGNDGHRFYVKNGVLTERPDAGISVDKAEVGVGPADAVTIANVPGKATLRVMGPTQHEITTTRKGDVELSLAIPGVYEISVDAFPHRDFYARVTVTA